MEPYADAACILKVNAHCDACKMKTMEILSSIAGVYSVTIDAEEGMVKISGEVDPNILLRALSRSGKHAELVWANIKHPVTNRSNYNDYYSSYNNYGYNNYATLEYPYGYKRALPERSWHENRQPYYPMRRAAPEYPDYGSNYYNDPQPYARHVRSYPSRAYDPYEGAHIGFCSIM